MNLKEEFKKIALRDIKRDGIKDLLDWLDQTDFYDAPASTRYHGSYAGGLLVHSLNVFSQLKQLVGLYNLDWKDNLVDISESIAIVSLFHDLCKVGCYKADFRWRKDANNKWEQYSTWRFEEDFAYGGHGAKSVFLVQSFMKLTPEEASAINCHMGQWDATTYSNPTEVYCRNKLAWLLHVADEAADYFMEKSN